MKGAKAINKAIEAGAKGYVRDWEHKQQLIIKVDSQGRTWTQNGAWYSLDVKDVAKRIGLIK